MKELFNTNKPYQYKQHLKYYVSFERDKYIY